MQQVGPSNIFTFSVLLVAQRLRARGRAGKLSAVLLRISVPALRICSTCSGVCCRLADPHGIHCNLALCLSDICRHEIGVSLQIKHLLCAGLL